MRRSHARPAGRKPWWFSSIFNNYVLAVFASVSTFLVTQRGCGPGPNPQTQHQDNARERTELHVLASRLQERDQKLAKFAREREEQKRAEHQRKLEQEQTGHLQRERKREQDQMESERTGETKVRLEQQQREKQALERILNCFGSA